MFTGDFNDHVWDEYQWEDYLNEVEQKSFHLRQFISPESSDDKPRWLSLLQENPDELDAVDAFIEEELQIDEVYFPEDEDDFDDWDDWEDFLLNDEEWDDEDEFLFEDEDDFDQGEEWKELSDEYAMSDYGSIDTLDVYNDSRELSANILQWAEGIHPRYLTAEYNNFIQNVLKIGAKVAGGYSFGFEIEFLGGNIAYTKKALYCANDALTILQRDLKGTRFLNRNKYLYFHEQLFNLRNSIGIYIQEMREQFYNNL